MKPDNQPPSSLLHKGLLYDNRRLPYLDLVQRGLVEIGKTSILLGGDLQETTRDETGWHGLIASKIVGDGRSSIYKLPHHGSKNSHNDKVWSDLLIINPASVLTPFRNGSVILPTNDDIARIKTFTKNFYTTSQSSISAKVSSDRVVSEKIAETTKSFKEVNLGFGQVRFRKRISDTSDN